jgi:hypothetical protein
MPRVGRPKGEPARARRKVDVDDLPEGDGPGVRALVVAPADAHPLRRDVARRAVERLNVARDRGTNLLSDSARNEVGRLSAKSGPSTWRTKPAATIAPHSVFNASAGANREISRVGQYALGMKSEVMPGDAARKTSSGETPSSAARKSTSSCRSSARFWRQIGPAPGRRERIRRRDAAALTARSSQESRDPCCRRERTAGRRSQ